MRTLGKDTCEWQLHTDGVCLPVEEWVRRRFALLAAKRNDCVQRVLLLPGCAAARLSPCAVVGHSVHPGLTLANRRRALELAPVIPCSKKSASFGLAVILRTSGKEKFSCSCNVLVSFIHDIIYYLLFLVQALASASVDRSCQRC